MKKRIKKILVNKRQINFTRDSLDVYKNIDFESLEQESYETKNELKETDNVLKCITKDFFGLLKN